MHYIIALFLDEDPSQRLELTARVVDLPAGREKFEVTCEGLSALLAIADGSGAVPPCKAEFSALMDGDTQRVLDLLARSAASALHHLFAWDNAEAERLRRDRRMFGSGN